MCICVRVGVCDMYVGVSVVVFMRMYGGCVYECMCMRLYERAYGYVCLFT